MITSKQNELIKKIRSLHDKKYRDLYNLYLVEGSKMVNEALFLGQKLERIICTEKALSLVPDLKDDCQLVTEEVFRSVTTEVSPQGVLAVLKKPENPLASPSDSCLFLDGVTDPANVGAIVRTAAAAGYKQLYLSNCADAYSPKAVRSSMSGIFNVKIYNGNSDELLQVINKPIIIADMGGENVFDTVIENPFCLVIGSEAHGVSEKLREKATVSVSIPMQSGMESLNAGVSAGILMYALKNKF